MQISKISNFEFKQNLWNVLWDTRRGTFVELCKVGLSTDKSGLKPNLPNEF